MSRIKNLKEKYPEYDLSLFDFFEKLDSTPSKKYLPLICKIFDDRFSDKERNYENDSKYKYELQEIKNKLFYYGIEYTSLEKLSDNEIIILKLFANVFSEETYELIQKFIDFNERGLIEKNDVLSYKDIGEVRGQIGLAEYKSLSKELEKQVVKEYEDDIWLAVKPLTFQSSIKYGSSTKWCTTYKNEKQYFTRYWRRGILIYFINKVNGLKYAVFKDFTENNEISWWNAADKRNDFFDLQFDDYMFPIIKNMLKTEITNMDLCDEKLKLSVLDECEGPYLKTSTSEEPQLNIMENVYFQNTIAPVTNEMANEIYLRRDGERVYEDNDEEVDIPQRG